MSKQRFYFDLPTENDDDAFDEAAEWACELSSKDSVINRIVFLAPHRSATSWLKRVYHEKYGSDIVNQLFNGFELKPGFPIFKILLGDDYNDTIAKSDVVIVMGTASDFLPQIEEVSSVKAIIAIPTMMDSEIVVDWIEEYNPERIRNQFDLWSVPPRK